MHILIDLKALIYPYSFFFQVMLNQAMQNSKLQHSS